MPRPHSDEAKYDEPNTRDHIREKDDMKQQHAETKSRELELREAFEQADWSESAGSPAQRLEIMSKAANDITHEREKTAAAKQKEDDADFWKQERAAASPRKQETKKDSQIKAPVKPEAADDQAQDAKGDGKDAKDSKMDKPDAKPSKPDDKADVKDAKSDAKADDKAEVKSESKPAEKPESPKSKKSKPTHDDDDDHSSEMPSERSSKLDRAKSSKQDNKQDNVKSQKLEEQKPKDKAIAKDNKDGEGKQKESKKEADQDDAQQKDDESDKDSGKDDASSDSDDDGAADKLDELLPFQERQQQELKARREILDKKDDLIKQNIAPLSDQRNPNGAKEALDATKAERLRNKDLWSAKHDKDNHPEPVAGFSLRETWAFDKERLRRALGRPPHDLAADDLPGKHVSNTLQLHSTDLHSRQRDIDRTIRGDQSIDDSSDTITSSRPGLLDRTKAKLSGAKHAVEEKLSSAKHTVEDKLDSAEKYVDDEVSKGKRKAVELKDDVVNKGRELKDDAISKGQKLKDDAISKGQKLKDDAVNKGQKLKDDTINKSQEIKDTVVNKGQEIKRDARLKKDEISRDIDTKRDEWRSSARELRSDIRRKGEEINHDVRDVKRDTERKASSLSEDIKSGVREDIDIVKSKFNEISSSVSRKADRAVDAMKPGVHREEVRDSDDSRAVVKLGGEPTMFQRLTSWWPASSWRKGQTERTEEERPQVAPGAGGIAFPTHRWSRDVDAKDMQRKLDELRAAEQEKAGGLRDRVSSKWQHLKADIKSTEHDWLQGADDASAQDVDNPSSSPRSSLWSSSSPGSLPHPSSFSPSLSDVSPSREPIAHIYTPRARPISPISSPIYVQKESFWQGFDATEMDAAVEPW